MTTCLNNMLNCRIIDFSFPQDILVWQANASTVSWYLSVTQSGKSDILMLGLFTMESDSIEETMESGK